MCSDDTVRIPLRARDGSVRAYTLVDAADADLVGQWTWRLSTKGYAVRDESIDGKKYSFRLNRVLTGLAFGDTREGDHRNLDKLDNRRCNLRVIPKVCQQQNMPSRPGSSSRFRGVAWNKGAQKWEAYIGADWKKRYLGTFSSEEEAAEVAREARLRLMPYATD